MGTTLVHTRDSSPVSNSIVPATCAKESTLYWCRWRTMRSTWGPTRGDRQRKATRCMLRPTLGGTIPSLAGTIARPDLASIKTCMSRDARRCMWPISGCAPCPTRSALKPGSKCGMRTGGTIRRHLRSPSTVRISETRSSVASATLPVRGSFPASGTSRNRPTTRT
jgi:hypothetical protein